MPNYLNPPDLPKVQMFPGVGTMSREWQNWFRDLYERVGGYYSLTLDEVEGDGVSDYTQPSTPIPSSEDSSEHTQPAIHHPNPTIQIIQLVESLRQHPNTYRILSDILRLSFTEPSPNLTKSVLDAFSILMSVPARSIYHHPVTAYEWIPADAVQAAGAKPATIGLNGGGFIVASFADNQEQQIQFNMIVPADMDRSQPCYLCAGWSSPTVSQDCDWEMTYLITAEDEDTEAAGTPSQSYQSSSATADGLVVSTLATIAAGTITPDDVCLHCVLERDGNDANDNLGDVAEVHGVSLRYTKNKH